MTSKSKKVVLGVVVCLIALIGILGATGPKHTHAESSIVINHPIGQVFAYIQMLKNGEQWSPWAKMDPNMKMDYHGQDGAAGNSVSWDGNFSVGSGTQTMTAIDPNKRIDYRLDFTRPMKGTATAYFTTEKTPDNQTKVTWGMDSENVTFMSRFMARAMNCQNMMEKVFAEGLGNMKAILEKPAQ